MLGKISAFAAAGMLLSACGNTILPLDPGERYWTDRNWVRAGDRTVKAPVYCYATLAKPDCYSEPQPGMESRFINAYEPPPALR